MLRTFSDCQNSWAVPAGGSYATPVTGHQISSSYRDRRASTTLRGHRKTRDHRIKTSVSALFLAYFMCSLEKTVAPFRYHKWMGVSFKSMGEGSNASTAVW